MTVPLLEPRDGMPPLIATPEDLAEATARLREGTGPVAVDAERASGFRYGHRAFLVQLRRNKAGTVLIDPIACPDLSGVDQTLAGTEAVLHAASQDLPCLADLGLRPGLLFDTELAGRLLGYPRVGLGTLVEEVLGLTLEKTHSAADWSSRPLPEEWLRYAALDVEVLVELRDALAAQLEEQGKTGWAEQEFAAVLAARPAAPRPDPWRRAVSPNSASFPASPDGALAGTALTGSARSGAPSRWPTPRCPSPRHRQATGRLPRTGGLNATRRRRSGWPPSAVRSPRLRTPITCRPRICLLRTPSAACPGSRPSRSARSP